MQKYLSIFLILSLVLGCGNNPLGENSTDDSFNPGSEQVVETPDTEAPTSPSSLTLSGNSTLTDSPSLSWAASSDNVAVSSYEIALGTTPGGEEVSTYYNLGLLTSYQFTSLSPSLNAATEYFISLRAKDEAGNVSSVATASFYSPGLSLASGAFQYPEGSFEVSCLAYLNSPRYNNEGDGLYWIDADGNGGNVEIQALCDMTRDSGGWTLIANRRLQGSNIETCPTSLDTFFQNSCGSPSSISSADSYSIGNTALRESVLSSGEWLFVQYDNTDTEDSDDAFIIHHSSDLFFTSTGVLNRTAVTKVCDINNSNCDETGVEFLWTGDGYFSGALCTSPYTAPGGTYFGNYGYCHNGASGTANSLFGNRNGYNETKLWGHPSGGGSFYERIFIR